MLMYNCILEVVCFALSNIFVLPISEYACCMNGIPRTATITSKQPEKPKLKCTSRVEGSIHFQVLMRSTFGRKLSFRRSVKKPSSVETGSWRRIYGKVNAFETHRKLSCDRHDAQKADSYPRLLGLIGLVSQRMLSLVANLWSKVNWSISNIPFEVNGERRLDLSGSPSNCSKRWTSCGFPCIKNWRKIRGTFCRLLIVHLSDSFSEQGQQ